MATCLSSSSIWEMPLFSKMGFSKTFLSVHADMKEENMRKVKRTQLNLASISFCYVDVDAKNVRTPWYNVNVLCLANIFRTPTLKIHIQQGWPSHALEMERRSVRNEPKRQRHLHFGECGAILGFGQIEFLRATLIKSCRQLDMALPIAECKIK